MLLVQSAKAASQSAGSSTIARKHGFDDRLDDCYRAETVTKSVP